MTSEATAAKKRAPRKTQFDLSERERLRTALLGYMEEHGIGVPTLQVRIAGATDRDPHLIPLKTLQRFLAAISRTNDAFLIPCFQFASTLPARKEPENFSAIFSEFFGGLPAGAARGLSGGSPSALARLAGTWDIFSEKKETRVRIRTPGENEFIVPYARCTLRDSGENLPLRTREEVFNPGHVFPFEPGSASTRHVYEGVVFYFEPLIFVLSRNLLTRLPCTYWLREFEDNELAGVRIEAAFVEDPSVAARPYSHATDYSFKRTPKDNTP